MIDGCKQADKTSLPWCLECVQVRSHPLKTLQHVGKLAHLQLPVAQRVWVRVAMRALHAIRATPDEVRRVLGPPSLPSTAVPADGAGSPPSVLHGVPHAMLQFNVPAVQSESDDAEGDSVACNSLGGTLGVPDAPVQFAVIESKQSDAAVEGAPVSVFAPSSHSVSCCSACDATLSDVLGAPATRQRAGVPCTYRSVFGI